jgi:hypothetical protein
MQVSFPMLLGLLFIGLKLAGIITWSWLWVLAPLWIGLAVGVVVLLLALIGFLLAHAFPSRP